MNKYESICDEAKDITENNRMKEYGHPIDKFSDIARFWNSYLVNKLGDKKTINHKDVAEIIKLFPETHTESLFRYIITHEPKTYWDLLNAATWVATHEMKRNVETTHKFESKLYSTVSKLAKDEIKAQA